MANPMIDGILQGMEMGRTRFLYGLDCVPDDRLTWSPGGEAKSALQLAAKTAAFLDFFSHFMKTRARPSGERPPLPELGSRDEAKAHLSAAFDRLRSALQGLSEEELQQEVPVPWGGNAPLAAVVAVVPSIIAYHQGQLNYLQLAYGDTDPNMPPGWGGG